MPQIPNNNSRDAAAQRDAVEARRMEALEEGTKLVVFLMPHLNGRIQPRDIVRLDPAQADQQIKSGRARELSADEANKLRQGAGGGVVARATGGLIPVMDFSKPQPFNLAPPLAARQSDVNMLLAKMQAGEVVERVEAQDRLGTIAPHIAIAAKQAAQGAGAAANQLGRPRAAHPVDAVLQEGMDDPGARHPLRELAAPGTALSGNTAQQLGVALDPDLERQAELQRGKPGEGGGASELMQAPDPIAEAMRAADNARKGAASAQEGQEDEAARKARERRERRQKGSQVGAEDTGEGGQG